MIQNLPMIRFFRNIKATNTAISINWCWIFNAWCYLLRQLRILCATAELLRYCMVINSGTFKGGRRPSLLASKCFVVSRLFLY